MRLVSMVLALALTACGQSGDLYLPPKPAPEAAPAPAAEPAPDDDKKKD